MASGLIARAEKRAVERRAAIGELLMRNKPRAAFHASLAALQSEAAKVHGQREDDGALIYAELAASLALLAAQLHAHKPGRPPDCRAQPSPQHLVARFTAIYEAGGQS